MENKNNNNTFKTVLITIIAFLVLIMGIVLIIKLNSPLSILLRHGIKQIANIEVVNAEKVKQLEREIESLSAEKKHLRSSFETSEKEKKDLIINYQSQQVKISELNQELEYLNISNKQLREQRKELDVVDIIIEFDDLTMKSNKPLRSSRLVLDNVSNGLMVQTPVERIEEATTLMIEGVNAKQENKVLINMVDELNNAIAPLQSLNAVLSSQRDIAVRERDIALQERDGYKKLYEETSGKTSKRLLISYGVVVVEAIAIVGLVFLAGK